MTENFGMFGSGSYEVVEGNTLKSYLHTAQHNQLTKYTGVDPELGYGGYGVTTDHAQTPRAKSYTFGVTVDF